MLATVSKEEALAKLQSMKRHLLTIREKAEAGMERAILGVEVVGGAAAVSYYNGLKGTSGAPAQVFGYDADLAAGVILAGAGILDMAGKHSDHFFNVGVGALASYATREAYEKGTAAATKK